MNSNNNIILNNQQNEAKEKIINWFNNDKKQIFVLSGYAGTGKTTLINYIINELNIENQTAFVAPTGKAASALIRKGSNATTIHHLIYTPVEREYTKEVDGKIVTYKKIDFSKKYHIQNYKLIVVDEISMVNNNIFKDLLSYKIKILATGDGAQLPPVASELNYLLSTPDYCLTEIVRQAKDNPILYWANEVRNNHQLQFGNFDNKMIILDKKFLSKEEELNLMKSVDQILCGKNETRKLLNEKYRKEILHIDSLYPQENEKLICNMNNYDIAFDEKFNLTNGIQGNISNFKILDKELKIASINFKPDFSNNIIKDILIDYNIFENNKYLYTNHQSVYFLTDGTYKLKKIYTPEILSDPNKKRNVAISNKILSLKSLGEFLINQFEYGYAISVHKSQGSEWNTVLIYDESNVFNVNKNKWLYTAITRGKEKVIIIK